MAYKIINVSKCRDIAENNNIFNDYDGSYCPKYSILSAPGNNANLLYIEGDHPDNALVSVDYVLKGRSIRFNIPVTVITLYIEFMVDNVMADRWTWRVPTTGVSTYQVVPIPTPARVSEITRIRVYSGSDTPYWKSCSLGVGYTRDTNRNFWYKDTSSTYPCSRLISSTILTSVTITN